MRGRALQLADVGVSLFLVAVAAMGMFVGLAVVLGGLYGAVWAAVKILSFPWPG